MLLMDGCGKMNDGFSFLLMMNVISPSVFASAAILLIKFAEAG